MERHPLDQKGLEKNAESHRHCSRTNQKRDELLVKDAAAANSRAKLTKSKIAVRNIHQTTERCMTEFFQTGTTVNNCALRNIAMFNALILYSAFQLAAQTAK